VPTDGTVARVARPRGEIPEPELRLLRKARRGREAAESKFVDACVAAVDAGGSYREVAKAAGIALSTLQKIVPPRKDRG